MDDGRAQRLRLVAAMLAVAAGLLLIYGSWGPLRNLFGSGPRDNTPLVYLLFGAVFIIPALVLLAAAWRMLHRPRG